MSIHLLGGGRDTSRCGDLLRPFVREARARAGGRAPVIALLLVLESYDVPTLERFVDVLCAAGADAEEIRIEAVIEGEFFDDSVVEVDAMFVSGGLTPDYAGAFVGIRDAVRARVAEGMPYAGFSAGAAIAAGPALIGGYRVGGIEVVSEDAGEELTEVEVRDGLGLVPFAVDVHAAQWGTLSRLVAAGLAAEGAAIDEHTALIVDAEGAETVHGSGRVWRVEAAASGVQVRVLRA